MSIVVTRLVSILVLALWISPSAGVLAMGLHLELDHSHGLASHEHAGLEHPDDHHEDDHAADHAGANEHAQAIGELATHGHYPGAAEHHDHHVRLGEPGQTLRAMLAGVTMALVSPASIPDRGEPPGLDTPSRHGPQIALFTTHCALLI